MIGLSDVSRLEERTRALREQDHRGGGENCLDDVRRGIHDSLPLLTARVPTHLRQRLHVAVADLRNIAGWICFDSGLVRTAHNHFCHALVLAGLARADGLTANLCYRLARVFLHHGQIGEALRHFELGRLSAVRAGDDLAAGLLSMNAPWACAKQGAERDALALLDRGRDEFTAANRADVAAWAAFFTEAEVSGISGAVYADLSVTVGRQHATTAVPLLTAAIGEYDEDLARSRTFSLILLSTSNLVEGDVHTGVENGSRALVMSAHIGSDRVRDRLRPLASLARTHEKHSAARNLADRIDVCSSSSPPP